jgi:hypothetical protein
MVFFSGGKGDGEAVDYGYKGKGVTTHLLVDAFGQPLRVTSTGASGEERRMKYWEGFLSLGILLYWVRQLVICGFC